MSLKEKTVSGLVWSFIDTFAGQGIQFIVGIILARILSPREFGLIGMITIFIAVSQSFIDSGFGNALIRKKDCSQDDYSTIFFFNLTTGTILFIILFLSGPAIGNFFKEPELIIIVQVFGLVLVIDSLSLIQRTILTKDINFKLQARISIIASLGSGAISIVMAYRGLGIWSLVAQRLSRQTFNSVFLWVWNGWKPTFTFSVRSFHELFGFGSKLLLSGLIDTFYNNIYYLAIGKFFSASELGYYARADQFKSLPSKNLNSIIGRVTYPILSSIQDDLPRLRNNYQKLIRSTMFLTFILMLLMAAVAKPLVLTLVGEKWLPCVIYLQMLCFVGMFYPLHALNLNMLQVQGRSDLFLKLEVIKKILAIPIVIGGIFLGIKMMIIGMMVNTLIAYYLNSFWSGRMIGYSFRQQLKDILPGFTLALFSSIVVFLLGFVILLAPLWLLMIQLSVGIILIIVISEIISFKDYIFLKILILDKIKNFNKTEN